jgi:hypothetical protein
MGDGPPAAMATKARFDGLTHQIGVAASVAIVAAAWGTLALLVWNLDRGFDLTDEASLLNYYRHPDAFPDHFQQHFRLVRAFVPDELDHIFYYRLFKLTGLVLFTAGLCALLARWLATRVCFVNGFVPRPIILFHFVLIGSLLAYCHGSQTLSYNDLVTFCLLTVAAACLALDLPSGSISPLLWRFIVSGFIGATIALLPFIKWPTAILLAGCFVLFIALRRDERHWLPVIASLAGAMCGAALFVLAASDLGFGVLFSYSDLFRALSNPNNVEIHQPAELIRLYGASTLARIRELLRTPLTLALLLLPFVAVAARAASTGRPRWRHVGTVLLIATAIPFAIFLGDASGWAWRHERYFFRYHIADLQTFSLAIALIVACCLFVLRQDLRRRSAILLLGAALFLAALPVAGAVGTNNPLLTQFIRHMGPMFAAFAITVAFLGHAGRWPSFAPVLCAAIAILSAAQIACVILWFPYRLPESGVRQTSTLSEPRHLAGLKVDAPTAAFIGRLATEAKRIAGDTAGMPVLALFDIPGAVYVLGGISVGYGWHSHSYSESVTCQRIQSDPRSRGGLRLIALDRDELPASLIACIRAAGIDLTNYQERARIEIPGEARSTANPRFLRLLGPTAGQ